MNGRAGLAAGSNRASDGTLGTIVSFSGRDAQPEEPVAERLVDRDDGARVARRQPLLQPEDRPRDPAEPRMEAAPEEDRHRLVQVEDHGDADHPERQRREDEEVGQRVHLDQAVAAPGVGADEREPGAEEEGQVLGQVDAEPGALVALDAEPADRDARDRLRAGSDGRRSAKTSTAWPAAASASASRRTRGSSS